MKLSTAAIFSMAVVPALADDTKDYILTCSRGMYREGDAQTYFSNFFTNTCYDSYCEDVVIPVVDNSIVSGGCTGCPLDLNLNGIPNCLLIPLPS
ncbi:hypothetical protein E4U17_003195 [Claviceps sp. LM77 group G4]|nr:hypothetical protein E4U17_003195 [Claviceps sp. LM77 group G4]KAG6073477.1 hypothetical protein E4U33_002855 [Claviceps sp. LM78 group G4]KAG6076392.1 hypothetical protein E4U16_002791 [Claviceps sp. LM84 group G4]